MHADKERIYLLDGMGQRGGGTRLQIREWLFIMLIMKHYCFKPLKLKAAYLCCRSLSSFLQEKAWRQVGPKPFLGAC